MQHLLSVRSYAALVDEQKGRGIVICLCKLNVALG